MSVPDVTEENLGRNNYLFIVTVFTYCIWNAWYFKTNKPYLNII